METLGRGKTSGLVTPEEASPILVQKAWSPQNALNRSTVLAAVKRPKLSWCDWAT